MVTPERIWLNRLNDKLIEQLQNLPNPKHDDQLDALSFALLKPKRRNEMLMTNLDYVWKILFIIYLLISIFKMVR